MITLFKTLSLSRILHLLYKFSFEYCAFSQSSSFSNPNARYFTEELRLPSKPWYYHMSNISRSITNKLNWLHFSHSRLPPPRHRGFQADTEIPFYSDPHNHDGSFPITHSPKPFLSIRKADFEDLRSACKMWETDCFTRTYIQFSFVGAWSWIETFASSYGSFVNYEIRKEFLWGATQVEYLKLTSLLGLF